MKKTPSSLALVAAGVAAMAAAGEAVQEPVSGGSFIRYPDGTLERDPEQPAQEERKARDRRMAADPNHAAAEGADTGQANASAQGQPGTGSSSGEPQDSA